MSNYLKVSQKAGCQIDRGRKLIDILDPKGIFHIEHYRNGKLLRKFDCPNGVTNEGKNFLLDVMFHGTTAAGTWYLSLVFNQGGTGVDATDTYDDINQVGNDWDEFESYEIAASGVTRATFTEAAASAQQITNSANKAQFDIVGTGTIEGVFCCGLGAAAMTQGDHAADGKLWATALFTGGDVNVENGDTLKVTYTVSC